MADAKPNQDFWDTPVKELPLQDALIVREDASVKSTIDAMQERKTGCAVVLNESDEMTGVFTERDVLVKYVGTELSGDTPIRKEMTPNAIYIEPDKTVSEAISFFGKNSVRHLPVCIDRKDIAGLLSIRVLTDYISEHLPEDILNLPPQPGVVSQNMEGA